MAAIHIEEPRHLQPNSIGIGLSHGFIDSPRHCSQIGRLPTGCVNFIERIGAINMVGTIQALLLIEESFLNLGKQRVKRIEKIAAILILKPSPRTHSGNFRIRKQALYGLRHMTGKGREHRFHAQFPLTRQNQFLQIGLMFQPGVGQSALPFVEIGHAVPGQMAGSCEIVSDFAVVQPKFAPHLIPYRLLPSDGQRHIHSVESHPVDKTFPVFPLPPGHGITKRAVVQKKRLFMRASTLILCSTAGSVSGSSTGSSLYHETEVLQ